MRGHRDLEIVAVGSIACALLALVIPLTALSLLFAAPLILFAPGYAIVAATFARRSLERQRMLLLSVALSLTTLVLGGFLLNYMPGGVRALSWAILLLLVVLGCSRSAALRRPRASRRASSLPRLSPRDGGLLLGGALLATAALALAMTTLPATNARGFTELWVTPQAGAVNGSAEIGVGSEEQHSASYILRVRLGDSPRPLLRRLTLHPGETRTVKFDAPQSLGPVPVTAQLFRAESPAKVYRRVHAWIPGSTQ
jgi:uncharacterized membrane protein